MFTVTGLALAFLASLVRGGRPRHAATARLHLLPLLVLVVVADLVASGLGPGGPGASPGLVAALLLQQGAVLSVVVANVVHPGMPLVGVGAAANALAVLANHGMPVSAGALEHLGAAPGRVAFHGSHHLASTATHLDWLTDVVPVPVLDVVVSLGDVLVVAGLVLVIDELLRPRGRGARAWRRAA